MNVFIQPRSSAGLAFLKQSAGKLLPVAMMLLMLAPIGPVFAQNDRQEQRAMQRERWMQRQQEMQERNFQREQMWQHRNQMGIPRQFDPNMGPERGGRMSPEERQALRRQIQEAGRSVYAPPPPNQ